MKVPNLSNFMNEELFLLHLISSISQLKKRIEVLNGIISRKEIGNKLFINICSRLQNLYFSINRLLNTLSAIRPSLGDSYEQ